MDGHLKLHRKLRDWRYKDDPSMLALWIDLLLYASAQEGDVRRDVSLRPGEQAVTVIRLAERTGLSVQQVRSGLKRLKKSGEIAVRANSKNSVITIPNWDFYQSDDETAATSSREQQTNNKRTTNRIPPAKAAPGVAPGAKNHRERDQ